MPATQPAKKVAPTLSAGKNAQEVLQSSAANELVFAVVGHVGSGTSEVAKMLKDVLEAPSLPGGKYQVQVLKARDELTAWAEENAPNDENVDQDYKKLTSTDSNDLDHVQALQDIGDAMREKGDYSTVARALVRSIRRTRAGWLQIELTSDDPVVPDGVRRAYILDSIRHPAEVHLLRNVYRDAFALIGVVCEDEQRLARIEKKYKNAGEENALRFMVRDAKASEKYGQRVSKAFHLADFFVDNTPLREAKGSADWNIPDELGRLVEIIAHSSITRPRPAETAMYVAYGAQMMSACLSRQVGAALMDRSGNVVATEPTKHQEPAAGSTERDSETRTTQIRNSTNDAQ